MPYTNSRDEHYITEISLEMSLFHFFRGLQWIRFILFSFYLENFNNEKPNKTFSIEVICQPVHTEALSCFLDLTTLILQSNFSVWDLSDEIKCVAQ